MAVTIALVKSTRQPDRALRRGDRHRVESQGIRKEHRGQRGREGAPQDAVDSARKREIDSAWTFRTADDQTAALETLLNEARIEANELRTRVERYRLLLASTRLVMGHELKKPAIAISGICSSRARTWRVRDLRTPCA
jgi:signal transduction histidine kinase